MISGELFQNTYTFLFYPTPQIVSYTFFTSTKLRTEEKCSQFYLLLSEFSESLIIVLTSVYKFCGCTLSLITCKALIWLSFQSTRGAISSWECGVRVDKYYHKDQIKLTWICPLLGLGPYREENILSITHVIINYFTLPDCSGFYGSKKMHRNYLLENNRKKSFLLK